MMFSSGLFKLAIIQRRIRASFCQQFLVVALLNDISLLHEQDNIRIPYRGKAVRNDEAGASFHKLLHGLTDFCLCTGIHAGGGFVQNQDWRVTQEYTGNRQKLPLTCVS